jgi:hypothetical protein
MERRTLLKALLGTAATFALGGPAARLFAAEPLASELALARGLGGGIHFLDGWILTTADLDALALHEV